MNVIQPQRAAVVEACEPRTLFATFVVTSTADAGAGTLRQAILDANASAEDDDIAFNIPGEGVHTIGLASPLPTIVGNVNLDASSQPGYDVNHTPVVELNGAGAGAGAVGLRIESVGPVAASNVIGLIISGFSGPGVVIAGDWNSLAQCYIGTDDTASAAGPGNGGHGVLITGDNNLLAENVIAFNGGDGAAVAAGAVGNTLAPNSFFNNAGLPIDLGDDGPTPNDPGDADDGPNRRQNAPVITSVVPAPAPATGLNITGTINTTPNTLVEIVIYASPAGSTDVEGRSVLEVLEPFETDASGNGTFQANLPTATANQFITATATAYRFTAETSETNTSEFTQVLAPPEPRVSEVYVRGTAWLQAANASFMSYLEAGNLGDDALGYRADGLAAGTTLPWININEVVLRYSAPPTGAGVPQAGAVTLDGVRSDYNVTNVSQLDPQTFALTLDRPLGNLPSGGNEGDRVRLAVPRGGGNGADYTLALNPLQGDADRAAGRVSALDLSFVKARLNRTATETPPAGAAAYTAFADLDANGRINALDLSGVKARLNDSLPPAPASSDAHDPAAGVTRDLFSSVAIL